MCVGVQKGQVEEQPSALAPFLPFWVSEFDLTWYSLREQTRERTHSEIKRNTCMLRYSTGRHRNCTANTAVETVYVCVSVV